MHYKGNHYAQTKRLSLQKLEQINKPQLITATDNCCKSACAIKTAHIKMTAFINCATGRQDRRRAEFVSVAAECMQVCKFVSVAAECVQVCKFVSVAAECVQVCKFVSVAAECVQVCVCGWRYVCKFVSVAA
jgi:hypothetical protein